MPIYSYQCEDCGAEAEYIQKLSDDPMTECESCGGRLRKKISVASFHLKGGGWYKDGYASTDKGESKKGGESSADSSAGDGGSKSDSGGDKSGDSGAKSKNSKKSKKSKKAAS